MRVRRTLLAQAYILHAHPYRDSSRILEVFTREQGRVSVFARGVRGPKARLASLLQPFQLLLISFSGRGDAAQLTGAESAGAAIDHGSLTGGLKPAALMSGFYLNELLLKLTTRHDPITGLFDGYREALVQLATGAAQEPVLRTFELRLLQEVGYGLDLTRTVAGGPVLAQEYYHFRPADGLFATTAGHSGGLMGSSLLNLAAGKISAGRELADARKVLSAALEHCLEGRPIATRAVARACVGTALVPGSAERS